MLMAAAVFASAAYAQGNPNACSNTVIAGTYSFTCSGWTGLPKALVPIMQVGVATGDFDGNWSGAAAINIGGQTVIPIASVVGSTKINPDCTGDITYYDKDHPTVTVMTIKYVANPKSDQIFGLIIDSGQVGACTLQRISR